jgi:hypothetical protein
MQISVRMALCVRGQNASYFVCCLECCKNANWNFIFALGRNIQHVHCFRNMSRFSTSHNEHTRYFYLLPADFPNIALSCLSKQSIRSIAISLKDAINYISPFLFSPFLILMQFEANYAKNKRYAWQETAESMHSNWKPHQWQSKCHDCYWRLLRASLQLSFFS